MKKIGLITSGGDCGGLNAVIKGAALMAGKKDVQVFLIPNGYAGLYNLVDFTKLTELTGSRLELIDANLAGSEAGRPVCLTGSALIRRQRTSAGAVSQTILPQSLRACAVSG